jgi:AcrR family transcriptional regulator
MGVPLPSPRGAGPRSCHTGPVSATGLRPEAPGPDDAARRPPRPVDPGGTGTPRELRRARQLETRRQEVLTTAEALFAAHGYEGTSLERIAAGSGHSVGTIYNLFPSKDAVYAAVLEQHAALLVQHLGECAAAPGTGAEQLLAMVAAAVRDLRGFPDHARMPLTSIAPRPPSRADRTGAMLEQYAVAIRKGQDDGTVRAGDPRDLARYVGGLIFAHMHVDPEIAGRRAGASLEQFLDVVRGALGRTGPGSDPTG